MAIIGNFTKEGDKIIGHILTFKLTGELSLEPVAKTSEKSPDYRVYAHGGVEIGAAWSKVNKDNEAYISVVLDDPSFPAAIQCALVSRSVNGYHLIWNR